MIKYALISVFDKTGILKLTQELLNLGIQIISTGGTARTLREAGFEVLEISDYTDYPELMQGRVKTLHPKVHGGLLAIRNNPKHLKEAQENQIPLIDFVFTNLYPFENTVKNPDVSLQEAIENIDIGGPSMLRSAAKNYASVTVVTDPEDYDKVIAELKSKGETSLATRQFLALKVFQKTANYDAKISAFLNKQFTGRSSLQLNLQEGIALRYGENPHQKAKIYVDETKHGLAKGEIIHGKHMSYNNFLDADAAVETVKEYKDTPAVCLTKHGNPCGLATGKTLAEAMCKAWEGDIVSGFGSVISVTRKVDMETASFLKGKFVEIIVAPEYELGALDFLKQKSKDLRIIKLEMVSKSDSFHYRFIQGAFLEQQSDVEIFDSFKFMTVSNEHASRDLYTFAYKACKHIKSNAIVIAHEYQKGQFMLLGIGAGQPNRVDALRKLAATKAMENIERLYPSINAKTILSKCVLASDAFFPFSDNIDYANAIGIKNIIQPGGSKKDGEVIEACNRYGIEMVFSGMRHFFH